jgi:hypothetical protein
MLQVLKTPINLMNQDVDLLREVLVGAIRYQAPLPVPHVLRMAMPATPASVNGSSDQGKE